MGCGFCLDSNFRCSRTSYLRGGGREGGRVGEGGRERGTEGGRLEREDCDSWQTRRDSENKQTNICTDGYQSHETCATHTHLHT